MFNRRAISTSIEHDRGSGLGVGDFAVQADHFLANLLALGEPLAPGQPDLDVRRGEILALVGPNGAGKSTLLGALGGDVDATGTVLLDDEPLTCWTPVEQAMRRAVLLQEITLSFPFTAREVVAMGRAPWAATPFEDGDESAIVDAMAATDVVGLAGRTFGTLSGGEKARVALARVLAQRTPIGSPC